jgi:hypothetical protein
VAIPTGGLSSYAKARAIALTLKAWIADQMTALTDRTQPVSDDAVFDSASSTVKLFAAATSDFWDIDGTSRPMDEVYGRLTAWARRQPSPGGPALLGPAVRESVNQALTLVEMQQRCRRLFAEAARDPSITVWFCANDGIAAMALDWCEQRRVRVPHGLSIISFDDSPIALGRRITSYNFNVAAIASAMLGHVLGRPETSLTRGKQFVEIDGFVVERGTSGKARG